MLRDRCEANGIIFMDNENIILRDHVCEDGVHLNASGSRVLCRNMLRSLNS